MKRLYLVYLMLILLVTGCNFRQLNDPLLPPAPPTIVPTTSIEKPTSPEVSATMVLPFEVNRSDPESVVIAFTYAFLNQNKTKMQELWRHDTPPDQSYILVDGKPPTYEPPRVEDDSLRPGKEPGYMECDVLVGVHAGNGGSFWYRIGYLLFRQPDGWIVSDFAQPIYQGPDDPTLRSGYLRPWKRASGTFVFEQELEPNRWLVTPIPMSSAKGIVVFSLDQKELDIFKKRFANWPLKGATLIVKGEDGGVDELGRKIIMVKGDSGLIPPRMP